MIIKIKSVSNELLVAQQLEKINQDCESSIQLISSNYPSSEVVSWSKQEQEARAYIDDPSAPTTLISAIASERGIPVDLLAQKIVEKSDAFAIATGVLIGKRQRLEDQLKQLDLGTANVADIQAIKW